jgi:hypothetical protein
MLSALLAVALALVPALAAPCPPAAYAAQAGAAAVSGITDGYGGPLSAKAVRELAALGIDAAAITEPACTFERVRAGSEGGISALAPMTISNNADLANFTAAVNGGDDFAGETVILGADLFAPTIRPIGTQAHPFNGQFIGAGHAINAPQFSIAQTTDVGLFGHTGAGSVISGLAINGGSLDVSVNSADGAPIRNVGVLGGCLEGSIDHISVSTALSVYSSRQVSTAAGANIRDVGGIAGHLSGSMDGCTYSGAIAISSPADVIPEVVFHIGGNYGGLVGSNGDEASMSAPELANSAMRGSLTLTVNGSGGKDRFGEVTNSTTAMVGGIVGATTGNVRACTNSGTIMTGTGTPASPEPGFGAAEAGGIVGALRANSLDKLLFINSMLLTGDPGSDYFRDTGAVPVKVGVYDCVNTGTVIGLTAVGGIVGASGSFTEIVGCANSGTVKGARWNKPFTGGIGGSLRSDVLYCYNTGGIHTVTGGGFFCAGIAGGISDVNINTTPDAQRVPQLEMTGCYNTGQIYSLAKMRAGILAGESNSYIHDNAYLKGLAVDGKVVDTDTGIVINNRELAPEQLKGSEGIAHLNTYAAQRGGWAVFYLPDAANAAATQNANNGYPVLSRSSARTIASPAAASSQANGAQLAADAVFSATNDPVPQVKVTLNGAATALRQNADYCVEPQAGTAGASPGSGPYQATVRGMGRYSGLIATLSYGISKADISACTISAAPAVFSWERQSPSSVRLTDAAGNLVDPSEYSFSIISNPWGDAADTRPALASHAAANPDIREGHFYDYVNAHGESYKYDVKVQALPTSANYQGSTIQAAFRIDFADLYYDGKEVAGRAETANMANVVWNGQSWDFATAQADKSGSAIQITYTGSPIRPTIDAISYLGRPLREAGPNDDYGHHPYDYDFKYIYGNTHPEENDASSECINVTAPGNPASVTIRFTNGGNFKSYSNVFFQIIPAPLSLVEGIPASLPSQTLAGGSVNPALPPLSYNGMALEQGRDFSVTYLNNAAPGTASAIVTGMGNYSGSVTVPYEITGTGLFVIGAIAAPQRALDIRWGDTADGVPVHLWDVNHTPAQRFRFDAVSQDGAEYYVITNVESGKCLDVPGADASQGAVLWQYAPNGSDAQLFAIEPNADGSFTISPKLNRALVLDFQWGATDAGTLVHLWERNGTAAQRMTLQPVMRSVADGEYSLRSALGASVLDVSGNSSDDGANVQIWAANATTAQRFHVAFDVATGYYEVVGAASGKLLDVAAGSAQAGANAQIWSANGTRAQKWEIAPNADGTFTLYSAIGGNVLDVAGAGTQDGTNAQTWPSNGTDAQKWHLLRQ